MSAAEQFSLRWNNHTSHLVGVFGTLLQSESLVDVTLSCEGRSLRAHKLVLSACSPYFKSLFQDHAEPHPIVILKDVKFSELRSIIQFMYSGEVEIDKEELDSLFSTAEGLMIRGLAGSRPNFAVSSPHEPSAIPCVTPEVVPRRKRGAPAAAPPPEPSDSGGEGGEEGGGRVSPARGRPPSPLTRLSNGGDSDSATKRRKRESESADENSNDVDAAGTTYLCPECGASFHTQNQLQLHHSTAHSPHNPTPGAASATGAAPTAGSRSRRPASGGARDEPAGGEKDEGGEKGERGGAAVAPAAHSHSWPPQDGSPLSAASNRLWDPTLRYLPGGRRFLPPLLPENSVLAGMMANLRPLVADGPIRPLVTPTDFSADGRGVGPLNLSSSGGGDGGVEDVVGLDEPSAPTTPTPGSDADALITCKVCTRVFETPAALREHASVHQGERPFRCHFCGKAFKFRHHLKDHCRIHTGERPFDCKICGKCFARSSILKTHAKIHRQEERRFDSPISLPLLAAPPITSSAAAAIGAISVSSEMALPALAMLPALPAPPSVPVLVKEEMSPDT